MKFLSLLFILLSLSSIVRAECIPPEGGKCLTKEQFDAVKGSLKELDSIHKSPAVVTTADEIVVIHDWNGRVYTNGGDKKPLSMKLRLGETIERDMAVILPTKVYYRPKPPDPMFRLRVRAQVGILIPELAKTFTGNAQSFWDGSLGLDFFHFRIANMAVYAGVRSVGIGPGIDLTKNFGITSGYAFVYDGFKSSVFLSSYFSFN